MKCLKCHVELGEKTPKFCPSCGTPTSLACNGCGAKIPEGARFCPECGSPAMRQQPKRLSAVGPGNAPAHLPEANSESIAVSASNSMSARFARFWAKGVSGPFSCWKFSNTSQEEAQNLADERVAQIAEKYKKAKILPKKYLYSDQRLREPVIKETHNSVISQNAYGCLVLNTADVMFIDIDFPEEKSAGLLKSFFKSPAKDVQAETLAHIASWTSQNPAWGWRIYRTFAGLRLLATNGVFTPDTPEVDAVFEALGADPLYRVLCRVQKCFRARLTPKPWRCVGSSNISNRLLAFISAFTTRILFTGDTLLSISP